MKTVKHHKEHGQVLLVIILIMVVSLTVGLSIATRSITNLRVSTEEENSQRAFYAAEAGVERALKTTGTLPITIGNTTLPDNRSKIDSVTISANQSNQLLLDKLALKDEAITLWLVDPSNPAPSGYSGVLTFYWGRANDPANTCDKNEAINSTAALEIIVIKNQSNPDATHYVYDPCDLRRTDNKFTDATWDAGFALSGVGSFKYYAQLPNIPNQGVLVRIVPLYASTPLGVSSTATLPQQGKRIVSTGSSGGTQHKIVVLQGNPKFPTEFFPYLILSPL